MNAGFTSDLGNEVESGQERRLMRAFSDREGRALSTPVYWEEEEKRLANGAGG